MFEFGKTLMTMNPEDQKTALKNATGAQRKFASEMGIGSNNRYGQNQQRQQQRQQKRDAFHDLNRLNHVVEKENEAHDFFGGLLGDWQKGVTGKSPSKDATNLKRQFDDYEHGILSELPKDGKRHSALSESLPKIKDGFIKQGHQFAVDKLNERSRNVLGSGLKRIAKDALGAKTDEEFQQHDDRAAGLINKYVLSEAKFDEKDADVFYDQFLKDAGVPSEAEQKKALAVDQVESVSGEVSDSWAGEAQLNAQPSKEEIAAEETKTKDTELQIPDGKNEVYEGSQYRGKVKDDQPANEGISEKPEPEEKPKETTQIESPAQRAQLRKVTPQVPDSLKKSEENPYIPEPYMGRKFNPRPGGSDGPNLTFNNDNPDNPSPDLAVHPDLATAVEEVAAETGLDLNINSTTGGKHGSSKSRHYQGKAVDINEINGLPVNHPGNIENVKKLQEAMNKHKGMRECYGPHLQEQNRPASTGRRKKPDLLPTHKAHIHFAVQ